MIDRTERSHHIASGVGVPLLRVRCQVAGHYVSKLTSCDALRNAEPPVQRAGILECFDPTKPAMVHDRLNGRTFEWKPATMQANYEMYAEAFGPDVIEWDGLLLYGWLPLGAQPSSQP